MTSNNLHEWRDPSQPPSGRIDDLPARRLRDLLRMRGQLLFRGGSLTYPLRIHPEWYDRAVSDLASFGLATYFAYEARGEWYVLVRDTCPRPRPVNADSLDWTLCRRRPRRVRALDDLPAARLSYAMRLLRHYSGTGCAVTLDPASFPNGFHRAVLDLQRARLAVVEDVWCDQRGRWLVRIQAVRANVAN